MIDHFNLPVADVAVSRRFFDALLAALGVGVIAEDRDAVGYGANAWEFGLVPAEGVPEPMHLAFKAGSQAQVDAFFQAGLDAGAKNNGAPGARPEYGDGYYACYLIDPDGHNIEAVFRG